jgi:hypothetical protein
VRGVWRTIEGGAVCGEWRTIEGGAVGGEWRTIEGGAVCGKWRTIEGGDVCGEWHTPCTLNTPFVFVDFGKWEVHFSRYKSLLFLVLTILSIFFHWESKGR